MLNRYTRSSSIEIDTGLGSLATSRYLSIRWKNVEIAIQKHAAVAVARAMYVGGQGRSEASKSVRTTGSAEPTWRRTIT